MVSPSALQQPAAVAFGWPAEAAVREMSCVARAI